MILLTSTSDIIRVVTGSAVSTITVNAAYVDNASGVVTPGRQNTNITTATTTTVVSAPGSSVQRNLRTLAITNNNATSSCQVTVQHFDGTTSCDLMGVLLKAGENLIIDQSGDWLHHDYQGSNYGWAVRARGNLGITGTLAETVPRELCNEANISFSTSGTLYLQGIYLYAGQLVSNITLWSATTAAGTPTNHFFALYDRFYGLKAQSANQTTAAWAANTQKTLAMTTAYSVPVSALYYIGHMMTATTLPTLKGPTARTANALIGGGAAPILQGTSSTGLTTALPNPAAAITTASSNTYWAAVT